MIFFIFSQKVATVRLTQLVLLVYDDKLKLVEKWLNNGINLNEELPNERYHDAHAAELEEPRQ